MRIQGQGKLGSSVSKHVGTSALTVMKMMRVLRSFIFSGTNKKLCSFRKGLPAVKNILLSQPV